jgi:hypothetical protein
MNESSRHTISPAPAEEEVTRLLKVIEDLKQSLETMRKREQETDRRLNEARKKLEVHNMYLKVLADVLRESYNGN